MTERTARVVPGGMYGHQAVRNMSARYPQYFAAGSGAVNTGTLPSDRAAIRYFDYNDCDRFDRALQQAGSDLAGVMLTPFLHIEGRDQELVDVDFARHVRRACDKRGALLVLDDVGDTDYQRMTCFAEAALRSGVYLHPKRNWFMSCAMEDAVIDRALRGTEVAFDAVRKQFRSTPT